MLSRGAVVRLTNRRVLQIKGIDAHRFLQGILTNDMKNVTKPKDAMYGAFLTTKGRILGDVNVVQVEDETFLLDYDESVGDDLTKHWKRYKLRMKVTLEDKSESLGLFAALPAAIAPSDKRYIDATEQVQDLLQRNEREPSAARGAVFRDPRGDAFGVRAILPTSESLKASDDYVAGDLSMYKDRRVFLGAAEGSELSDSIPLEADLELLRGVSFRKGCYVGQELTARTQFKGNVRKRLVPVALIPTSHEDVVKQLSEQPFQQIDASGYEVMREYLLTEAPQLPVPSDEKMSLVKPGSSKAVGSISILGSGVGAAIAMMRLEHLLPKEDGEAPAMQFATADGAFHAVPYQPTWWPQVDAKTGKMML